MQLAGILVGLVIAYNKNFLQRNDMDFKNKNDPEGGKKFEVLKRDFRLRRISLSTRMFPGGARPFLYQDLLLIGKSQVGAARSGEVYLCMSGKIVVLG